MSRKKRLASVTSAGLVFAMLLSQSSVANLGAEVVKAADDTQKLTPEDITLKDCDFSGDFWSDGIWQAKPSTWDNATVHCHAYTDDDVKTVEQGTESTGGNLVHYWMKDAGNLSISQSISELPAGEYTITAYVMGDKSDISFTLGDSESEKESVTEWGTWKEITQTFEIEEDKSDVTAGIYVDMEADGYGYIDHINLVGKTVESDNKDNTEETQEEYKITASKSVDSEEVSTGDSVSFSAKVTKNGKELTDDELSKLHVYWYTDKWIEGHEDGIVNDNAFSNYDTDKKGVESLETTYTFDKAGVYYIVVKLQDEEYADLGIESFKFTVTDPQNDEAIDNDDIVVKKVENLSSDFVMGMDISSVVSEFESGVVYKDYDGNAINNVTDFCRFLADNGINHIRVRVWNDPYDSNGNGYGGGDNDVNKAKIIADACRKAGINMLVDFHCSDFWADPSKQQAPKAWKNYTLEQKETAVKSFIEESLNTIDPEKNVVDMVQVGNETTGSFIGETGTENMCKLFSAGSEGVKAYNTNVKVVIHVTNPEKMMVTKWAKNLDTYKVNYDILATSYYPYWHGSLDNLKSEFKKVKDTYGKDVMVAETSYAYTLENSDGHDNTVRVGSNDDSSKTNCTEPFTVQGQATSIRNLINAVNEVGGLGVYYWEPAWITVGDTTGLTGDEYDQKVAENKIKWETYGSGWASSYAGEYDANDAGKWYGGSAVDNEAMFYSDGTATAGLKVWNYVKTGAIVTKIGIENIENASVTAIEGQDVTLPETVNVTYNTETVAEKVTWNTDGVDITKAGTYTVEGTFDFSKDIERGAYKGMKSATVKCTVIIKAPNLITDSEAAGFEKKDVFSVNDTDKILKDIPSSEDVRTGKGCVHWYNGNDTEKQASVTYNESIALESGEYAFEFYASGFANDKVYALVLDEEGNVIAQGENVGLTGWNQWITSKVSFKLEKATSVKLVVGIISASTGWGSVDDMYLYQTKAADASDDNNTGDNDNKNDNTNTGDNDNKNDNTNTGDDSNKSDDADTDNNGSSNSASSSTTTTDKTLAAGSVVASTDDSKTTVKDTKGILPATVKFESKKVTDENEVTKVTDVVKDKIAGVKDVAVYELSLTDGTTQIHQLADKVQVTMDMPFTLADNEAIKVFRVDGDKLVACTSSIVDGKLVFETDHFSTFAFVKVKANAAKTARSAKTSDENNMYMWLVLAMAGVGVTIAAASKKKQTL